MEKQKVFQRVFPHMAPEPYLTPIGIEILEFSVRSVLQTYVANDPSLFTAVKVSSTKPAIPGQTLKIQMWQKEDADAYVDLNEAKKPNELKQVHDFDCNSIRQN